MSRALFGNIAALAPDQRIVRYKAEKSAKIHGLYQHVCGVCKESSKPLVEWARNHQLLFAVSAVG